MYAYVSGTITLKTPTMVVIESGGVGYELQISLYTYGKIEQLKQVKLWTQLIVREDSHTLFGFHDPEERVLFNYLISVSGIGPNTARLILSGMSPADVESAILTEDEISFKRVKGVGPKTAKRLIIDLKDKLIRAGAGILTIPARPDNTARSEALSALIALGYPSAQAQKAIAGLNARMKDNDDTESWVKAALQELVG
ncbi:MAG TPA: Holliday junction branch migration protein RuvA [Saprospiraceae bacterium]|nr:Holliday junction branch migration protein RuvA [Saprospiraceae bacterium]